MNNVCVTGFYGTGSSAVLDYLKEFDTSIFLKKNGDYEDSTFYIGGGLFELRDRLFGLASCYSSRSIAINDFIALTDKHYRYNFGWFGSYKKLIGPDYLKIRDTFINSISTPEPNTKSLTTVEKTYFSPLKACLQVGAHCLKGYKISRLGIAYKRSKLPFRLLNVDEKTFLAKSREFLSSYCELCKRGADGINVFDHLVSAEQIPGVLDFFPGDLRVIVVDRDPVDLYLVDKYIWPQVRFGKQNSFYPPKVTDYCDFFSEQRRNVSKIKDNPKIFYLKFESLVYDYENSTRQIEDFLGLSPSAHTKKLSCLDPKKSIVNTNLSSLFPNEKENIEYIRKRLSGFLYQFPEDSNPASKKMFLDKGF